MSEDFKDIYFSNAFALSLFFTLIQYEQHEFEIVNDEIVLEEKN